MLVDSEFAKAADLVVEMEHKKAFIVAIEVVVQYSRTSVQVVSVVIENCDMPVKRYDFVGYNEPSR